MARGMTRSRRFDLDLRRSRRSEEGYRRLGEEEGRRSRPWRGHVGEGVGRVELGRVELLLLLSRVGLGHVGVADRRTRGLEMGRELVVGGRGRRATLLNRGENGVLRRKRLGFGSARNDSTWVGGVEDTRLNFRLRVRKDHFRIDDGGGGAFLEVD